MTTHTGSCHCKKVVFEFTGTVDALFECNCSICRQMGALWHSADADDFRIVSGDDDLGVYRFGTRTAKHFFCVHCGIHTFSNPRLAPDTWAINLRCVEDMDLEALPKHGFDGRSL